MPGVETESTTQTDGATVPAGQFVYQGWPVSLVYVIGSLQRLAILLRLDEAGEREGLTPFQDQTLRPFDAQAGANFQGAPGLTETGSAGKLDRTERAVP